MAKIKTEYEITFDLGFWAFLAVILALLALLKIHEETKPRETVYAIPAEAMCLKVISEGCQKDAGPDQCVPVRYYGVCDE